MTNQDLNRRFAELCGLCRHEWVHDYDDLYECKKCLAQEWRGNIGHPNFIADPRLVLREMVKRHYDFAAFAQSVGGIANQGGYVCVPVYLILDTTGLLVKAAIEWLEKEDVKDGQE